MYALSRLMLILTVIGCCGCLVAVAAYSGGVALIAIPIALIAVAVRRRSGVFTAHGTARWATLKRLAVCRNGWCQERADHRQDGE